MFTIYGHGGHHGHVTRTIRINFRPPFCFETVYLFSFKSAQRFRGEGLESADGRRRIHVTYDLREKEATTTATKSEIFSLSYTLVFSETYIHVYIFYLMTGNMCTLITVLPGSHVGLTVDISQAC